MRARFPSNPRALPSLAALPLAFFVVLMAWALSASEARAGEIAPDLAARLETMAPGETISALVYFRDQPNLARYVPGRASGEPLIRELREKSQTARARIEPRLASRGLAKPPVHFWIVNAMELEATPDLIRELAALEEVARVERNAGRVWIPEEDWRPIEDDPARTASPRAPEWQISKIRADQAWSVLGLDGSGIVIGVIDTGVLITHEALAGKWRGGTNSWLDVITGMPSPYVSDFHGNFVTALIVGGDGSGALARDIGPAYGAQFIFAKIFHSGIETTDAMVLQAGQWMLDPDGNPATDDFPHIINNSWGTPDPFTGYYDMVGMWRTAGIIPVFAIGNSGPTASTTHAPGNYNNCIGVGGTDINNDRYDATSVGPAPAGAEFAPDGRKPDLSAPGEAVLSIGFASNNSYGSASGTSLACPLVSGTVALMLQANPSLTYDEIMTTLRDTAVDHGTAGYDFVYGYGRIDAYAAALAATPNRVFRVDGTAGLDANDGMAWTDLGGGIGPMRTLQGAIDAAEAVGGGQIWVMGGTYAETLTMASGVELYGGFAGGETSLSQRDAAANPVIIDNPGVFNSIITWNGTTDASLDGFWVTGGNTIGGGGILFTSANATNIATNCVIAGNRAVGDGGGIYVDAASSPRIENVVISGNSAVGPASGGGMKVLGSPTLVNVVISGNSSANFAGGLSLWASASPSIFQSVIAHNTNNNAGGVQTTAGSSGIFRNVAFVGNELNGFREAAGAASILSHCLFHANTVADVEGSPASTNAVSGDPLFAMDGPSAVTGVWDSVLISGNTRILTDASASFIPGALVGRMIQADESSLFQYLIIANTSTQATIAEQGVLTSIEAGDSYRLVDYRTGAGAGLDAGADLTALEPLTAFDADGNPRPYAGGFDIGAYELQNPCALPSAEGALTNAASVVFAVDFNVPINGVDATGPTFDNFAATVADGLGGSPAIQSIAPATAPPATRWNVTVGGYAGEGTLELSLTSAGVIADGGSAPLHPSNLPLAYSWAIDQVAPGLNSALVQTELTVDVEFDEQMGPEALNPINYHLSGSGMGTLASHPDAVTANPVRFGAPQTFRLTWLGGDMVFGGDIAIEADATITDLAGNSMGAPNSATHLGGAIPVELSAFELE
jgi:serine protease AprX